MTANDRRALIRSALAPATDQEIEVVARTIVERLQQAN